MSQVGVANLGAIPPPPGSVTNIEGQDSVIVAPDGSGIIHVIAQTVAAGTTPFTTTGNAGTNTETWSIQRSQAIAATDSTKIGLCNFSSSHFSVDANGFVTLAGAGQAIDSIGTQTGTNPITPTAAGLVTINGAVVAAGTNPLRTNGTGANMMALEAQISQAIASTDATKIGLCNFNSNQFAVDANGFTTLTNSSSTKPAFLAVLASTLSNVTGDGTQYTVVFDTEVFDQNNNFNGTTTFTAPVNGVYFFTAQLLLGGLTASFTGMNVAITTTARNYLGAQCNPGVQRDGASNQMTASVTCLANMTAGQTATLNISVSGSTKTISLPTGGATDPRNYFAGYLVA